MPKLSLLLYIKMNARGRKMACALPFSLRFCRFPLRSADLGFRFADLGFRSSDLGFPLMFRPLLFCEFPLRLHFNNC